jgi:selenophosphate synthetase-related protein
MLRLQYEEFLSEIHNLAKNPDSNYIDAIVNYAEQHGIEIESLAEVIRKNPNLRSRVQDEAEELFMLERTAKLPV